MTLSSLNLRSSGEMLSVAEQIADRICAAILAGELTPGQRIAEIPLAQNFNVSRGPVREALRLLEAEGLVTFSPRRGAQVTTLTTQEVEQLFDIRAALSALAAEQATQHISKEDLSELHRLVKAMAEVALTAESVQEYTVLSARAGLLVAQAAQNPRLLGMIHSLSRQTLRYAQLGLSTKERRQESARCWQKLAQAMETGDGEAAGKVNAQAIRLSRDAAIRYLREGATA